MLVTFRFLATGKMQLRNRDDFGISQPSISKIVDEKSDALVLPAFQARVLKSSTRQENLQQKQAEFMEHYGFPGVVCVIDDTHIHRIYIEKNITALMSSV